MSVTLKSMIIGTLLIILAIFLYRLSNVSGQLSADEISKRFPSFVSSDFSGKYFDNQGLLSYSFQTSEMTYYKHKQTVEAKNIIAMYYEHKDKSNPLLGWKLTADKGSLVLNSHANLNGNIKIVPNFPEAVVKEIATEHVYFNIKANILSSKELITIKGDQFINQGSNYLVDLSNKNIVIKDKPHATYFPNYTNNSDRM